MEAEVSELIGAERGERTEDRATHRNGYRPAAVGHPGGRDRAADPQDPSGQLLPEVPAAAQALRAGAGLRGPAGLCLRRLDPAGRSARREPRAADLRVEVSRIARAARRAGRGVPRRGRWRAATRICSSTPRSRRSATAAACSARRRDRARRARDRPPRDHRPRRRRGGDRGVLDGLPALPGRARPGRRAAGHQRRARRA